MLPELLEVVHELIDAVEALRGISGNRASELHAQLAPPAAPAPAVTPAAKVADGPDSA